MLYFILLQTDTFYLLPYYLRFIRYNKHTTSRFVVCLGVFSQERQELWLPKDDLRDSSSWSSPPLRLLRDIHSNLLTQYDWKEVCVPSQSQVNVGTGVRPSSQDGVSQKQEPVPLSLP